MLTYDGEQFRHVALRGVPPAYADFMENQALIYARKARRDGWLPERIARVIDVIVNAVRRSGFEIAAESNVRVSARRAALLLL